MGSGSMIYSNEAVTKEWVEWAKGEIEAGRIIAQGTDKEPTVFSIASIGHAGPERMSDFNRRVARAALEKGGYVQKVGTRFDSKAVFTKEFAEASLEHILEFTKLAVDEFNSANPKKTYMMVDGRRVADRPVGDAPIRHPPPPPVPIKQETFVNLWEVYEAMSLDQLFEAEDGLQGTIRARLTTVNRDVRDRDREIDLRGQELAAVREELRQVKIDFRDLSEEFRKQIAKAASSQRPPHWIKPTNEATGEKSQKTNAERRELSQPISKQINDLMRNRPTRGR